MNDLVHALQSGTGQLWLFIPTAILLGALHGLEPGHSKTMMAAFIIAIRGTVMQAVLLGVSAAFSHSLIIWLLAAFALRFGNQWNAETVEPYLQIGSAICILGLAAWMFLRTRRDLHDAHAHNHHHGHDHGHGHHHHHGEGHEECFLLDTGHGKLELSVFEEGVPPVFRISAPVGENLPSASQVSVETVRPDGSRQRFEFATRIGLLESKDSIPEPHEFDALLTVANGSHSHTCRAEFREAEHHHSHSDLDLGDEDFQDAHERAHALDIEKRFAGRHVTTGQIALFGITGGLMPCPAAFTVLLVCLQLKRVTLGVMLVASFSFGLALTMVATGTLAAISVQHAQKRFRGFGELMRRAPYVSCALLVALATYMAWHGWQGLAYPR